MGFKVAVILNILINTLVVKADDASFGACLPGKESCSECYLTLKQSLLGRDDNIQQLSNAFFPPRANIPEFVTVTYVFENTNDSQIWYWTHDSSYLFFQFTTFQYLSLFFGKPAELFSQELSLILDEECITTPNITFRLLKQRLKNFIAKKSFNPIIDENYFARSEIDTEDILSLSTADFIVVYYIAGFIIVVLIAIILLWTYRVTHHWDRKLMRLSKRSKANKNAQSKIFSVAVTTGVLTVYVLVLDILSVKTLIENRPVLQTRNIDDKVLPYMVLALDVILNAMWLLCWICSCGKWICNYRNLNYADDESEEYLLLALSTVPPVISFAVHLPYITIAYLNDASHATSMFIYYTLVVFAFFGAIDLTYSTYVEALVIARETQSQNSEERQQGLGRICGYHNYERRIQNLSACGTPTFALLIVFLVGMTTAALVSIPISKAFTDTSDRLLGFYQTAFVFVGAYVVYQNIFEKKPLEKAIENRTTHIIRDGNNDQWQNLSKDEKITALYSRVIDILAQCDHQASSRSKEAELPRDIREQRNNGLPQEVGHTSEGCCNGQFCSRTILSSLRSALSLNPASNSDTSENTPLNV